MYTFQEAVEANLKFECLDIKEKIIFSDGCQRQCKSTIPLYHLTKSKVPTTRVFFGHGKWPCDAAAGVAKRAVTEAVRSRETVVNNSRSMAYYCNSSGLAKDVELFDHSHASRAFIVCDDVERPFFKEQSNIQRVDESSTFHQVTYKCDESMNIHVRPLACFCSGREGEGPCSNGFEAGEVEKGKGKR